MRRFAIFILTQFSSSAFFLIGPTINVHAQALFDNHNAWLAAAGPLHYQEDFSTFSSNSPFGTTPQSATDFGFFSIFTSSGNGGIRSGGHADTVNGTPFAYLESYANLESGLVFHEPIRAFGFNGGSLEGATEVIYQTSLGNSYSSSGGAFRGIVLNSPGEFLSGVSFRRQSGSDGFGLDNLSAASDNPVDGMVAFSTNFDQGVPVQFSGAGIAESVQGFAGLGRTGNQFANNFLRNSSGEGRATATTLHLTGLPFHTSVDIDYLLAILESWDGGANIPGAAPDIFEVWVDGTSIFSESFETAGLSAQSYLPPPNVELARRAHLGNWGHSYPESAYDMARDPRFDAIPHTADTLTVQWFATGGGWQAGSDESWAIDNVSITLHGDPTDFVWTGAGATASFDDASNWSPSGVPGNGDTATISGNATISGEGHPALLTINPGSTVQTAGLTLSAGSIVNRGSIVAGANAVLRFANDSIDNANGHIVADGVGATARLETGTNVNGGTLSSTGNGAIIDVAGATVSVDLVQTTSLGRFELNSGLLRVTTLITNAIGVGDFDQLGGRLEVLNFDGNFEQDGGVYSPGLPTGPSSLTGTYILRTGATLEIELGSGDLGEFDQLFVGGLAIEGGQLSIAPRNGFQAAAGDSFGVISIAVNRTGSFLGLNEGDLVGDFGEDLYITYKAGDGNDIGLYNPLVLGSINFADAGPNDDAFFVGERTGSGVPAPPVTITLASLDLLNGSSFTLDPNETLELNGGTLFIGQGAVFTGNGIIRGNVINAGLLRIPIVRIPTITQTVGGYIEIDLPPPPAPGAPIVISGGGGGLGVAQGTLLSFEPMDAPTPIVVEGTPAPNEGVIRFDASLEITGSFEQRDTGALRLFIAGDDLPGENYSQLIVGEGVTLAGSLEIVFDPTLFNEFGYTPMVGDTFDLVVADGGITIADSGLELLNFVTSAGAPFVSGVSLSAYNSGIAADPDSLMKIGETLFRIDLVENDTILRATLINPIQFVPEPTAAKMVGILAGAVFHFRRRVSPLTER